MTDSSLADARSALARCEAIVYRLHKMCCDPGRSPRIVAIEASLASIRRELHSGDGELLGRVLEGLDHVGSQIGHLQVGCCAPARMPLYAEAMTHLNAIQLAVTAELGLAH